jgi:hypothetical protein
MRLAVTILSAVKRLRKKKSPRKKLLKMSDIKPSHVGKLHRALGIPEGKPIPWAAKKKAANSKSPAMRKMGQYAVNVSGKKG